MQRFTHTPGNGTKYELFINKTDHDHTGKPQYFHIAWMRYGTASGVIAKFGYDSFVHYSYFREKILAHELNISNADVAPIMAFMRDKTGVRIGLPEGFDENGLYKESAVIQGG